MTRTAIAFLLAAIGGAENGAEIRVPVTFVGAPPASVVRVVAVAPPGKGPIENRVEGGRVTLSLPRSIAKIRLEAGGFEPVELSRQEVLFGVTFFARARVLFRLDAPAGSRPDPEKCRVIATTAGPSASPHSVSTSRGRENTVLIELASGEHDLLFDDSVSLPAVFRHVAVGPGEERVLPVPPPGKAATEHLLFVDELGQPVSGAAVAWRSRANVPEADLYGAWMENRRLQSDPSGNLFVDRIPPFPYELRIQAKGFRPAVADAAAKPAPGKTARKILLRRLPSLEVSMNPGAPEELTASARLIRIPDRPKAPADGSPFVPERERLVWEGELRGSAPARVGPLAEGRYRAIVRAGAVIATGEADLDVRESAPDLQRLVVNAEPRTIRGRVTRAGFPWPGVSVEAVPADAVVLPDALRLAEDVTTGDGYFRLTLHDAGMVLVQARRPDGTPARGAVVDLRADYDVEKNLEYQGRELRLKVLDAGTGEPVPRARLAIQSPASGRPGPGSTRSQATGEDGTAAFDDIGAEFVDVTATAESYATRSLHDVKTAGSDGGALEIRLRKAVPLRLRIRDDAGRPVMNAEVFRQEDPFVSMPRLAPLTSLGRSDPSGELVLRNQPGIAVPIFAIAAGYSVQVATLPGEPGPEDDADANTLYLVLYPLRPGPSIQVIETPGKPRPDAILLFARDDIEIPTTVLRRLGEANGLAATTVMLADRAGNFHVQDYLSPGIYKVFALSPVNVRDPRTDLRDPLGSVRLPLERDLQLQWLAHRPSFLSGTP